jgi:hypothetical protein
MKPFADHFSALAAEYASCRPHYPSDLFTYLADVAPRRQLLGYCLLGPLPGAFAMSWDAIRSKTCPANWDATGEILPSGGRFPGR